MAIGLGKVIDNIMEKSTEKLTFREARKLAKESLKISKKGIEEVGSTVENKVEQDLSEDIGRHIDDLKVQQRETSKAKTIERMNKDRELRDIKADPEAVEEAMDMLKQEKEIRRTNIANEVKGKETDELVNDFKNETPEFEKVNEVRNGDGNVSGHRDNRIKNETEKYTKNAEEAIKNLPNLDKDAIDKMYPKFKDLEGDEKMSAITDAIEADKQNRLSKINKETTFGDKWAAYDGTKKAVGVGTTAFLVSRMADSKGSQTNAQLFGQQTPYGG